MTTYSSPTCTLWAYNFYKVSSDSLTWSPLYAQHRKASNHHANLPLEMYSFTLQPPGKHLETTGADDPTLWLLPEC